MKDEEGKKCNSASERNHSWHLSRCFLIINTKIKLHRKDIKKWILFIIRIILIVARLSNKDWAKMWPTFEPQKWLDMCMVLHFVQSVYGQDSVNIANLSKKETLFVQRDFSQRGQSVLMNTRKKKNKHRYEPTLTILKGTGTKQLSFKKVRHLNWNWKCLKKRQKSRKRRQTVEKTNKNIVKSNKKSRKKWQKKVGKSGKRKQQKIHVPGLYKVSNAACSVPASSSTAASPVIQR